MLDWIYTASFVDELANKTDVKCTLMCLDFLVSCYAAAEKYAIAAWKLLLLDMFQTRVKRMVASYKSAPIGKEYIKQITTSIQQIYECTLSIADPLRLFATKYAHNLSTIKVLGEKELEQLFRSAPDFAVNYLFHLKAVIKTNLVESTSRQLYRCTKCKARNALTVGKDVRYCGSCGSNSGYLTMIELTQAVDEEEDW